MSDRYIAYFTPEHTMSSILGDTRVDILQGLWLHIGRTLVSMGRQINHIISILVLSTIKALNALVDLNSRTSLVSIGNKFMDA